jgi:hypothetical protein
MAWEIGNVVTELEETIMGQHQGDIAWIDDVIVLI